MTLLADLDAFFQEHRRCGDCGEIREDQFGDRTVRLMVRALGEDVLGRTDVLDALDISDADLSKRERRATARAVERRG